MSRGAISKLVDRLAAKKLVSKVASEEDRRYFAVALTKEGRTLVPKLAAFADQNEEEFFNDLSASERDALMRIMKKIVDLRGLKEVPTE